MLCLGLVALAVDLAAGQSVPFDQPLPCMTSPIASIEAGTDLIFELLNYRNATCEATINFQNNMFLPISTVARPRDCAGGQTVRVALPKSIPNGTIMIQWECAATAASSCVLTNVTGGAGDPCQYQYDMADVVAEVECMNEADSWYGFFLDRRSS